MKVVRGASDWGKLPDRSDVLIVDTETTGAGKWAEVADVAVIDTTGAVRYRSAVLPASNIPRDGTAAIASVELLLLTTEGARPWPECREVIRELLANASVVCAYNAAHDRRVMHNTSIRYGLALPRKVRWRCLMLDYAAHLQILESRGGWQRHKLKDAAAREGVLRGEQVHEALPDCKLTLNLMRAVAGREVPEETTHRGKRRPLLETIRPGLEAIAFVLLFLVFYLLCWGVWRCIK